MRALELHVDRQLGEWCFELQARLRRAEAFLLHPDCQRHHAILAAEIERFNSAFSSPKRRQLHDNPRGT